MKVSALRKQSCGLFLAGSGEVGTECEALGNRAVKCEAFGRALLFPPVECLDSQIAYWALFFFKLISRVRARFFFSLFTFCLIIHFKYICGCSSSGRAPPCQGGGSGFEPRHPLQKTSTHCWVLVFWFADRGMMPSVKKMLRWSIFSEERRRNENQGNTPQKTGQVFSHK